MTASTLLIYNLYSIFFYVCIYIYINNMYIKLMYTMYEYTSVYHTSHKNVFVIIIDTIYFCYT